MSAAVILVAGGAGYIGSHMVRMLREAGWRPVVVDALSTGHRDAVGDAAFEQGEIGDRAFIEGVLRAHRPQCVMHFAAASLVAESIAEPERYWHNNVEQTQVLLDAMQTCGIGQFIFSSTAAVFGVPERTPVDETHPKRPINPYGMTKLAVERMLDDRAHAQGLRSMVLRYFNAAGAHPDGSLGERHEPETHLIPLVLQVASGRRPWIARYGSEHPTQDGSCVRDYVHVQDLCEAHMLALQQLQLGVPGADYNLGNGRGFSVDAVISAARRITGHRIPVRDEPARPGDPPVLVADSSRARRLLGWTARHPELDTMIAHAWQWEQRLARESRGRGSA